MSEREKENEKLAAEILEIHERSRNTNGSIRVHAELRDRGYCIGRNRASEADEGARVEIVEYGVHEERAPERYHLSLRPGLTVCE